MDTRLLEDDIKNYKNEVESAGLFKNLKTALILRIDLPNYRDLEFEEKCQELFCLLDAN